MTKRRKNRQDRLAAQAGQATPLTDVWNNFKKHPVSLAALVILILMIALAIASGFIWDYDTQITGINSAERLLSPCKEHPSAPMPSAETYLPG